MKIKTVVVGPLETNCYILTIDEEALIIDPGDEYLKIAEALDDKKLVGVIITHYHFDHVGALEDIQKKFGARVYDFKSLKIGKNKIGKFQFECIYTPGHKDDLVSIYFENKKALFCGDFIFQGTIGRWDLEGGSYKDMQKSIEQILKYDDMTIYPGHGPITSLANEKNNLEKYLSLK